MPYLIGSTRLRILIKFILITVRVFPYYNSIEVIMPYCVYSMYNIFLFITFIYENTYPQRLYSYKIKTSVIVLSHVRLVSQVLTWIEDFGI